MKLPHFPKCARLRSRLLFARFFPLALLLPLFLGTTFIIREGGVEVGRYEEIDGKNGIEIIEFGKSSAPPPSSPASRAKSAGASIKPTYSWYKDEPGYRRALDAQSRTGKPIALYFHATWCPYCRAFERKTLETIMVRDFLKPVIRVQIDIDKSKKLQKKFGVNGIPRFLAVTQSGMIQRLPTNVDAPAFIEACRHAGLLG